MIRFNCPNCGRYYELPDALARLPLVCKQCGQRITPPEPTPDTPPPPPPKPAAPKPAEPTPVAPKPAAGKPAAPKSPAPASPPKAAPPVASNAGPPDDDQLVAKPDSSPDIDFDIAGPTAASLSEAARTRPSLSDANRTRASDTTPVVGADSVPELDLELRGKGTAPAKPIAVKPAPAPEATPGEAEPTMLPFLADAGVFLVLVVVGMFLGELLVHKPTGQVLSEAGSAPKFPPVDLLLWAAPPVLFGLVYLLLGSRGRTVGEWLRRRRASA